MESQIVSMEVLHREFIRIKDGININEVKDQKSFVTLFEKALEQARVRMKVATFS